MTIRDNEEMKKNDLLNAMNKASSIEELLDLKWQFTKIFNTRYYTIKASTFYKGVERIAYVNALRNISNIVNDLIKAMTLTSQYLLDPNYNPEYQTGRYAGENKLEVLLKRNISGYRSYDRILTINKNNNYYKVGESQIGINIAKNFGELLNE